MLYFFFLFLGSDERLVLSGEVFVKPHQDLKKAGDKSGTQFSKYVEMIESLKGSSPHGEEFINFKVLQDCVLDCAPKMATFFKAIIRKFHNGDGKSYCKEVSDLSYSDLCKNNIFCSPESRDTHADGFKLKRVVMKVNSTSHMSTRSSQSSPESFVDNLSLKSSENMSDSNNRSNRSCDLMALSPLYSPLAIFECNSNASVEYIQGLIKLVSHGLALRDKKQVKHEIKLVLVTPVFWYSASLPPYKEPEDKMKVYFEQFSVFFEDGEYLFLKRNEYLSFLRSLRQHYELVQSVE